jgi:hypothetical protein
VQSIDNGQNALSSAGEEIDTSWTQSGRLFAARRGLNVVNFPSTSQIDNDWGIAVAGYGYGLVFSYVGGDGSTIATKAQDILIRSDGTLANNNKTTVLAFETASTWPGATYQPGKFNYGIDFRGASPNLSDTGFNNSGGCCAIVTNKGDLSQLGKIGNPPGAANLAGVITVPAGTTSGSVGFTDAYTAVPICVVTPQKSAGGTWWVSSTATAVTVNLQSPAPTGGLNMNWICIANPN